MVVASGCTTNPGPFGLLRQTAPGFSLQTLDGRPVSLSGLQGKVVVLDFWATWCPPCREALPHLEALGTNADFVRRGLAVLAIDEQEKPATVRAFLDQARFTFPVVLDADGSIGRAYEVSGLPTTVIIGREGLVQAVISGWTQETAHQIDDAVAHALDAPIR
jgi:thiol-disulfide isomerase/thioredoxin